ncbi:MAG: type II toxin-antitoxin system VapC family toxin [Candidatus Latescibacteria bacterium]|nr:type II toxin-antitoxin system VapC family toxin [Candidatus Latescibacterota bacterium]
MKYLLDTNTCINYLNGTSENIKKEMELNQLQDIAVCSVVKAELFYGALKSAKTKENLEKVHKFVDMLISLPFDDKASEKYGEIRSELEKSGIIIGPNDLIIASIALVNNVTLVTHNTREFKRVKGLKTVDWEKQNKH